MWRQTLAGILTAVSVAYSSTCEQRTVPSVHRAEAWGPCVKLPGEEPHKFSVSRGWQCTVRSSTPIACQGLDPLLLLSSKAGQPTSLASWISEVAGNCPKSTGGDSRYDFHPIAATTKSEIVSVGGVQARISSVVCECQIAIKKTACPAAKCGVTKGQMRDWGEFTGFVTNFNAAYHFRFDAYTESKPITAANRAAVRKVFKERYEAALADRADQFADCEKTISAANVDAEQTPSSSQGLKRCVVYSNRRRNNGIVIEGSQHWTNTATRCTMLNPLVGEFFSQAGYNTKNHRKVDHQLQKIKNEVRSRVDSGFPNAQRSVQVYQSPIVFHGGTKDPGIFIEVSISGQCEYKYWAIVTRMKGSQPHCQNNGQSGNLCEPLLASTLLLWMSDSSPCSESDWCRKHKRWYRPNNANNPASCKKLDIAVRQGITAYRFVLANAND